MNNEQVADKLEEIIAQNWDNLLSLSPDVFNFSILFNPGKYASWFVVFFFKEMEQLRKALKNGECYRIHAFLTDELMKKQETSDPDLLISFEQGDSPADIPEMDVLYEKLLDRTKRQMEIAEAENKICGICGHSFDRHKLSGFCKDGEKAPTEGWIICPEEDCNCFRTWNIDY